MFINKKVGNFKCVRHEIVSLGPGSRTRVRPTCVFEQFLGLSLHVFGKRTEGELFALNLNSGFWFKTLVLGGVDNV